MSSPTVQLKGVAEHLLQLGRDSVRLLDQPRQLLFTRRRAISPLYQGVRCRLGCNFRERAELPLRHDVPAAEIDAGRGEGAVRLLGRGGGREAAPDLSSLLSAISKR
jgi:hypothetical protein